MKDFDVIVVGGGHAGCEAALASARMGVRTALITMSATRVARMSCNPSVGGMAKSHLVYEIDALGGEIGRNADATGVQFKTLNTRKGPAVQATRIQCDKEEYPRRMLSVINGQTGLRILESRAEEIVISSGTISGVILNPGGFISARAVVICAGTYLNGKIFIGKEYVKGGRIGEASADGLTDSLKNKAGLSWGRLKTGTPPRVHRDTVNYRRLTIQKGEIPPPFFSFETRTSSMKDRDGIRNMFHVEHPPYPAPWPPGIGQIPCYLTQTTARTHEIVADNLGRSALYGGMISGTGVRYCPSIEDKVKKFPDRDSHHVFVEPEGRNNHRIYPNGTSNSLPEQVQREFIRSIPGFESASFIRPGYAIEYDFFDPTQLDATLECKKIEGLFLAGQVNGTTGYEEAAAQGLMAGVNAAFLCRNEPSFTLGRDEAYIGVLIDDLVTKGVDEPYRMFTSRAEYRLQLRQDNAIFRLRSHSEKLGIVGQDRLETIKTMESDIHEEMAAIRRSKRNITPEDMQKGNVNAAGTYSEFIHNQAVVNLFYQGYIEIERESVSKMAMLEKIKMPEDIDYKSIRQLKRESIEKLGRIRPLTLGQASRIPGLSPTDILVLSMWIRTKAPRS